MRRLWYPLWTDFAQQIHNRANELTRYWEAEYTCLERTGIEGVIPH